MKVQDPDFDYCRAQLALHDPDLYLASLLSPAAQREGLWALYAFWAELARVRLLVSEVHMGLIRLQWWRDEIKRVYAGDYVPKGGLMDALAVIITRTDLPAEAFEEICAARALEIQGDVPTDLDGALGFLSALYEPFLKLVTALDKEPDKEVGEEASTLSVLALNMGVVDVLRRARASSFAAQNKEGLANIYEPLPVLRQPALKALDAPLSVWFSHMRSYGFDPASPKAGRKPYFFELRACIACWT